MADTTGQANLRAENISSIVTGFALQAYKLKQLCMVNPSSAWTETYYKETAADLTGGAGSSVRGVPRLAAFPYGEVSFTKTSAYLEKYGMEGVISWEDKVTNNIDVIARTLLRIGRSVAKAIDTQIAAVMLANAGNSVAIVAGSEWNAVTIANRDPITNILSAKREMSLDNYDADDGNAVLVVNPTDYANLLGNSKIINNPTFKAADVVKNGMVGELCGCKIIVSNTIGASGAFLVKSKEALTWKEAKPLTVNTIENPGISYTIRAFEVGVCQVPNPDAIVKITGTLV